MPALDLQATVVSRNGVCSTKGHRTIPMSESGRNKVLSDPDQVLE